MNKRWVAVGAAAVVALGGVTSWAVIAAGHGAGAHESVDADAGAKPGKDKKFNAETPDNALFARLKAQAGKKGKLPGTNGTGAVSPNPTIINNYTGINDPNWYPPDWNGATGPSRYVEVINNRIGFYNGSAGLLSSATTFQMAATSDGYVGDPEINYDPATKKFYYALMDQDSSGNWFIDYGFSKIQKPSSVADFCHYQQGYGTDEPDYPRLGGTKDFILIGVNIYAGGSSYTGSRVQWARKPSAGSLTTCPTGFATGVQGGYSFTPVPSHQTDPSSTGYILASVWSGGSTISKQKVTKSSTGTPVFSTFTSYSVTPYTMPADAPQPGTTDLLNTSDSRLYQVVQSYDPRLSATVLWTSLTTFAGAGSGVEWFELKAGGGVAQQGVLSDSSRYVFNGTNSSDRAYTNATTTAYGSNMGIDVTTSSSSQYPSMAVATKRGTSSLSPLVTVVAGTGAITCGGTCRWGDRSSAHASVATSTSLTTGRIYFSNGWASPGTYQSRNVQVAP